MNNYLDMMFGLPIGTIDDIIDDYTFGNIPTGFATGIYHPADNPDIIDVDYVEVTDINNLPKMLPEK